MEQKLYLAISVYKYLNANDGLESLGDLRTTIRMDYK